MITWEEDVKDAAVDWLKVKTTTSGCLMCNHAHDELIITFLINRTHSATYYAFNNNN